MPLVTEAEAAAAAKQAGPTTKIAILVFNGVEIIDYTGPYEVFGAAGYDVYTVGKTKDQITTAMGMTVVPKYSFADAPQPDVLVVPGGGVRTAQGDSVTLTWIKDETALIQHTMSVCNGAFILANAGLLNGLSATTTAGNIEKLRSEFPRTKVVSDQRYVDNGKIITTAGLSAGIDGALHVVSLISGAGYAEQVALIEEYDWKPRNTFVRGALADRLIPDINLGADYGKWDIVSTEGGTDNWESVFRGTSKKSATELMDHLAAPFAARGDWTAVSGGSGGSREWRLKDKDGTSWRGFLTIQESSSKSHEFEVRVKISKIS
jgi:putative intracellular protease/amidase